MGSPSRSAKTIPIFVNESECLQFTWCTWHGLTYFSIDIANMTYVGWHMWRSTVLAKSA